MSNWWSRSNVRIYCSPDNGANPGVIPSKRGRKRESYPGANWLEISLVVIINKAGAGHIQSETGDSRIECEDCQTCTLSACTLCYNSSGNPLYSSWGITWDKLQHVNCKLGPGYQWAARALEGGDSNSSLIQQLMLLPDSFIPNLLSSRGWPWHQKLTWASLNHWLSAAAGGNKGWWIVISRTILNLREVRVKMRISVTIFSEFAPGVPGDN